MFLIAQDAYRDLRWVSIDDMQEAQYKPIIVPSEGQQLLYVVRSRNRLLHRGQFVVVTADGMQSSRDSELHVLCGHALQDPVFWMARLVHQTDCHHGLELTSHCIWFRTKLVHALTGQQQSNDLATNVFWNPFQLPCPCELTWQKHCHGGIQ
ncbi:hypothetical protein NEOLEDRAFT_819650 [Neolentinus lepideus HHB14362 ss-1]|uniref:Uncharacterized protein n=1 Tax=Neolentinus lepideus HHB14362 ss-1 TaxID=1314782 RepID=A0A165PDU2_9AGAM|nr:hypothetical protein NEOLEDRAFT_819650 [Neolentinus lepideus HHB14362 ss-1]